MRTTSVKFLVGMAIVSALTVATPATATQYKFRFAAEIWSLSPSNLNDDFSIGQSVIGTFFVDDHDLSSSPQFGTYTARNLSVQVGPNYTLTSVNGVLSIQNMNPGDPSSFDEYLLDFSSWNGHGPMTGAPIDGYVPDQFNLQVDDFHSAMLNSDALPLSLPLPPVADPRNDLVDRSHVNFGTAPVQPVNQRVSFIMTSLQVVPEPGSFGLAVASSLGALFLAYRKKQTMNQER